MLFFQDEAEADRFAEETSCAKYHSKLPSAGENKEYYFDRWTRGDDVVMAASTAFQQGVDYPWVAYVVYYKSAYGLIDYHQGGGRAGRRGRFSEVIILRNKLDRLTSKWSKLGDLQDTRCEYAFSQLASNLKYCMRYLISNTMDGTDLAVSCKDTPGCNPCGVCDPSSEISVFIRQAINTPMLSQSFICTPSQPTPPAAINSQNDDDYGEADPFTAEMALVMDSYAVPQPSEVNHLP